MTAALLVLYLQWNLLLAAAWLCWLLLKPLLLVPGCDPGQRRLLLLARALLAAALLLLPVLELVQRVLPAAMGWVGRVSSGWFAGELMVVPEFAARIESSAALGLLELSLLQVVLVLLLSGLLVQAWRLVRQWQRLRSVVAGASEWKKLNGTQLLVSATIDSPFATRALGGRRIVVPEALLLAPPQLRLAVQHELQHIRNGDLDWLLLLEGIRLLCFWNPAVRLWYREFEQLHELACDEALVAVRRIDTQAYGECLLTVAAQHAQAPLLGASNMVPGRGLLGSRRAGLRRRIMKLTHIRNIKHGTLKTLGLGLLLGGGLLGSSLLVVAADGDTETERGERLEYLPTKTTPPQYPTQALKEGLEGWVTVQFTVDATGKVQNPEIVDNCAGASIDTCTRGEDIFDANSLAAVATFEFEPRQVGGSAVPTEGVQYHFRYNLDDEPAEDADAEDAA